MASPLPRHMIFPQIVLGYIVIILVPQPLLLLVPTSLLLNVLFLNIFVSSFLILFSSFSSSFFISSSPYFPPCSSSSRLLLFLLSSSSSFSRSPSLLSSLSSHYPSLYTSSSPSSFYSISSSFSSFFSSSSVFIELQINDICGALPCDLIGHPHSSSSTSPNSHQQTDRRVVLSIRCSRI